LAPNGSRRAQRIGQGVGQLSKGKSRAADHNELNLLQQILCFVPASDFHECVDAD